MCVYVFVLIILGVLDDMEILSGTTFVRGSKAYILNNIMQREYRQRRMKSAGSLAFTT